MLEPVTVSVVSSSRRQPPFGLEDGGAAKPGNQYVTRSDGRREQLDGVAQAELDAGDVLTIETPGGGGFGAR